MDGFFPSLSLALDGESVRMNNELRTTSGITWGGLIVSFSAWGLPVLLEECIANGNLLLVAFSGM
jgi:hypothetical protein